MDSTKSSVKIFIGLPIILLFAGGLGFAAAQIHTTLVNDTSTTDEVGETVIENENTQSNDEEHTSTTGEENYIFIRTALEEDVARLWAGSPAQYRVAAEANLSAYCQLLESQAAVDVFPVGLIRDKWVPPPAAYEGDPASNPICPYLPSNPTTDIPVTLDRDTDGLPAVAEIWYGTSDSTSDTDADGFTDVEEISNGYSPLTSS